MRTSVIVVIGYVYMIASPMYISRARRSRTRNPCLSDPPPSPDLPLLTSSEAPYLERLQEVLQEWRVRLFVVQFELRSDVPEKASKNFDHPAHCEKC